ncbi:MULTISPECIES: ribosome recycling factor [Cryobacterium]|uniref:Ribosome-recycling factor n=1 Tax=Cryobacterium glucosi TaxID=1259175 RepID=A0ABY2ISA3_9MICO|nr:MULTISPECIES: ribosome recycling factor [Cryobacterium]MDY7528108.1 ribosome recycling factor [Cryobacterium sp. 10C2]MDY7556144.1 ribosome recycling factor [Cryobacterium sp. 10C3]MEB0002088.1 ribosome recycling factor [Cryobacterium sp. RTC2.1]MEB0200490.1 ribosome recycling factor [Cryobacterium sp. 5I3]MEB0285512.1 ribosome recycling factor [Cryobacterium sp. 10S3]
MIADVLSDASVRMHKALEAAKDDFGTVRTGRANPQMFAKILVNYYGTQTPLEQLASLQNPEARTLLIGPYDKGALRDIEQAIRDTPNLDANLGNDGNVIRATLPELTADRRKEYVKIVRTKAEDAKISVRNLRRKAKDELDALKSEVGDDDVARAEKELEQITKTHVDAIDTALKHKEAELLEI